MKIMIQLSFLSLIFLSKYYVNSASLTSPKQIRNYHQQKEQNILDQNPNTYSTLNNISSNVDDINSNKNITTLPTSNPTSDELLLSSTLTPSISTTTTTTSTETNPTTTTTTTNFFSDSPTSAPFDIQITTTPSSKPSFRPHFPRTKVPTANPTVSPTLKPTHPTISPSLKLKSNNGGKNQATSSPSSAIESNAANVTSMDVIMATPGVFIMIIVMSITAACLLTIRLYFCFRKQPDSALTGKNPESLAIPMENVKSSSKYARRRHSERSNNNNNNISDGKPKILKFSNSLNDEFSNKYPKTTALVPSDNSLSIVSASNDGPYNSGNIDEYNGGIDENMYDSSNPAVSYENLYYTHISVLSPQSKI